MNPRTTKLQLLIAFFVTAVVSLLSQLFGPAQRIPAFGVLLDLVPVATVAFLTVLTIIRLKHTGVSRSRLIAASYCYFAGGIVAVFGLAHLVAVLTVANSRALQNHFVYDFRFYSLIQLGLFLIVSGFVAAIHSIRLAPQGGYDEFRTALRIWLAILLINAPLIPLQNFAILFSVFSALALLLILKMRRSLAVTAPDRIS